MCIYRISLAAPHVGRVIHGSAEVCRCGCEVENYQGVTGVFFGERFRSSGFAKDLI